MSLKNIFIGCIVLLAVIVGFFYLGFRTKTEDLSYKFPYSQIINQTLVTKHPCYIALNYEHFILENPYILKMKDDHFDGSCNPIYKLPVGSAIQIENTKAFTGPVSGTTNNAVLGSIYLKELHKTVKFEFYWGDNPTYGLYEYKDNYDIYPLAPWQEKALPFKYFWDGRKEPHNWQEWHKSSK
ncbi:hypothetical protein [Maribacter sp.]|uniref:hypothetical protein n=1 Tax=Maribacter sp. TaxID=1897614 RepID=UPI0025C2CA38|nr:hypothetical protein [Maribacter sp.]